MKKKIIIIIKLSKRIKRKFEKSNFLKINDKTISLA